MRRFVTHIYPGLPGCVTFAGYTPVPHGYYRLHTALRALFTFARLRYALRLRVDYVAHTLPSYCTRPDSRFSPHHTDCAHALHVTTPGLPAHGLDAVTTHPQLHTVAVAHAQLHHTHAVGYARALRFVGYGLQFVTHTRVWLLRDHVWLRLVGHTRFCGRTRGCLRWLHYVVAVARTHLPHTDPLHHTRTTRFTALLHVPHAGSDFVRVYYGSTAFTHTVRFFRACRAAAGLLLRFPVLDYTVPLVTRVGFTRLHTRAALHTVTPFPHYLRSCCLYLCVPLDYMVCYGSFGPTLVPLRSPHVADVTFTLPLHTLNVRIPDDGLRTRTLITRLDCPHCLPLRLRCGPLRALPCYVTVHTVTHLQLLLRPARTRAVRFPHTRLPSQTLRHTVVPFLATVGNAVGYALYTRAVHATLPFYYILRAVTITFELRH